MSEKGRFFDIPLTFSIATSRDKGYRPWRNRAIIYCLIETGMRRAAVTRIDLAGVDFERKRIATVEKGGFECEYHASARGLQAIRDYLANERGKDANFFHSPTLFLPACTSARSAGRLHPKTVNDIWNRVCKAAGISGKTPHSARHAMGNYIIEKTGNPALVQKQLNHLSPASSLQYTRSTGEALDLLLDARES